MLQPACKQGFIYEPSMDTGMIQKLASNEFYCDITLQQLIVGVYDNPHAAATEFVLQVIPANLLVFGKLRRFELEFDPLKQPGKRKF
jgi:hypothetical protein